MKLFTTSFVLTLTLTTLFTSCSSTQKAEGVGTAPEVDREFNVEYVLIDASTKERPNWILDPKIVDDSTEWKSFRYFVSEASHTSKRLCLRSAKARASANIAAEVVQFIKNTYSEASQGTDEDVSTYMQEQLTQEVQSFVVGIQNSRTYWEKRKYKKDLGASADKIVYQCYSVAKIKRTNLTKMMKMARTKILKSIDNDNVMAKTKEAIGDVEKKFDQLERN